MAFVLLDRILKNRKPWLTDVCHPADRNNKNSKAEDNKINSIKPTRESKNIHKLRPVEIISLITAASYNETV